MELDSVSKPGRGASPAAVLLATVTFLGYELLRAFALGGNFPLEYYLLCTLLAASLALPFLLIGFVIRHPLVVVSVFAGVMAGYSTLPAAGVTVGCLGIALAFLPGARAWSAARTGVGGGLFLALALQSAEGGASRLGLDGLSFGGGEAALTGLMFALLLGGVSLGLERLPRGARGLLGAPLLLMIAAGLAFKPWFERPDGSRRLPPPGYATSAPRGDEPQYNAIVLVLDTVRADHMSIYGYERPTTPELDHFLQSRENAVLFQQAYANGTWTVPSHASLFTGRLPHEHGAHFDLEGKVRFLFGVDPELPTLAEEMQQAGYATLGTFANSWLRTVSGMGRGFERWFLSPSADPLPWAGEKLRQRYFPGRFSEVSKGGSRADRVNATLLSMLDPWSEGPNPMLLFANYGDAHGPYVPPPGWRGRFHPEDPDEPAEHLSRTQSKQRLEVLEARYDEEIAYLDHQLGELLRELDRRRLLDVSWVFITSDHGEAFDEHGVLEHGTTVHNEVTRIPLMVLPPRGEHLGDDGEPVSLVDVAATVAAIAGRELPGPGRDLRASRPEGHVTTIEFYGDESKAQRHGDLARHPARAVLQGSFKLIARGEEVFLHHEDDEGEQVDLSTGRPDVVQRLRGFLPEFGEPTPVLGGSGPSKAARQVLEDLGYGGP